MTVAKPEERHSQTAPDCSNGSLSNSVRKAMENYFADLDGHEAGNLYDLFLAQVEKPMFEVVMQAARGNITRAAQMLGLNRGTLRNRLKKYGLE
jgi:Fis family transcriptional regulator